MPWRVLIPGRAFARVIVFIPRSGDGCKPGDYDPEWLPRRCPACGQVAIIGHGRRRRQAHDGIHVWILIRRGLCKICGGTLTVLPGWCVPGTPYSLLARQQTLDLLGQGVPAEQAAPHCAIPIASPMPPRSGDGSGDAFKAFWFRLDTHPVCLGLARRQPYSDRGDPLAMIPRDSDTLRRQISLLDYLQEHGWKSVRDNGREEVAGLCPLHRDRRPSFYVNRRKQVFYCHGCAVAADSPV